MYITYTLNTLEIIGSLQKSAYDFNSQSNYSYLTEHKY